MFSFVNTPLRSPQGENLRLVISLLLAPNPVFPASRLSRMPACHNKTVATEQDRRLNKEETTQKRQAGTARGGKTGPRGRERSESSHAKMQHKGPASTALYASKGQLRAL